MAKSASHPLVVVEWVDSASTTQRWALPLDVDTLRPMMTRTAGYLIEDSPDYVTVVPHVGEYSEGEANYSGDICIPRCAIKSMWRVTEMKRKR